ncbi:claudin-4-like [Oreochromis aureus]|uniref:claudin-4-like n=1 Tax=Oreochromis aureus TaxID=47969 RepID=UPI0019543328|nr:claudin-4-like [Oreochromis aureus]
MDAGRRQILGLALAINGVLGTIMICALPAWKVLISTSVYPGEIYGTWYGLWKICTIYTTGKMECVGYEVFAPLVDDTMKAIRALVIIAILSGIFGILLGVAGNKRTNFMLDDGQKRKVGFASGVVFIIAGFLVFIPVCWMANIIIRDSYELRNYDSDVSIKLGASLYIGWFTTGFLFLGGGLLLYRQE